ncbi:MAG: acyltransferase family protein [Lachnospiraceae bacterium]|nr:acyltransferase family protein [Lachnospiraceae bacterium]
MEKQRLIFLDIAIGIAILAVIIGHAGVDHYKVVTYAMFLFHVPLFFLRSGYLINEKKEPASYIFNSIKRLLPPYLILCLGIWLADCCTMIAFKGSINLKEMTISRIIATLYAAGRTVTLPNGYMVLPCGYGWFFVALLVARLAVYFMVRKNDNITSLLWVSLLACAGVKLTLMGYWPPFSLFPACIATVYVYLGWWMKKTNFLNRPLKVSVVVIGILLWIFLSRKMPLDICKALVQQGMLAIIGSLLACLLVITLSQKLARKENLTLFVRFLRWCGENSLWILVVSGIESRFYPYYNFFEILSQSMGNYLVAYILLLLAKITLTLSLTFVVKKLYSFLGDKLRTEQTIHG